MPKVDQSKVNVRTGSRYPAPHDEPCKSRRIEQLADAGGVTQFGAHRITLPPGGWSSQRHWHSHEDEFVYMLEGELVLVDDSGETTLLPGDATAHPAGDPNGHHMINRSDKPAVYLVVGSRRPEADSGHYPDIDMHLPANGAPDRVYLRKDGSSF